MAGPWWSRKRTLAIALGVVLVLGILAQIVNANVLNTSGDPNKYGQLTSRGPKSCGFRRRRSRGSSPTRWKKN